MKIQICKNIKYKGEVHKAGDVIYLNLEDVDEFVKGGIIEENMPIETPDFESMKKDEIGAYLEGKGIEYNRQDRKQKLIDMAEQVSESWNQ